MKEPVSGSLLLVGLLAVLGLNSSDSAIIAVTVSAVCCFLGVMLAFTILPPEKSSRFKKMSRFSLYYAICFVLTISTGDFFAKKLGLQIFGALGIISILGSLFLTCVLTQGKVQQLVDSIFSKIDQIIRR